jgi:dethiobiotin synthetase
MSGIFVTGTDTSCGKTVVCAGIVNFFTNKGINCGYMKPISCGSKDDNDAVLLKKLLNLKDPLSSINPVSLPYPLSPYAAAKMAKKRINIKKIVKNFTILSKKYEILVVEGAGGALVPITKDYMVADLIKDLGIPAIIVARAGLGTLNHTFSTIEVLRKRKIEIQGVIMNGYTGKELSEKTNAQVIEKIGGVPVLAKINSHTKIFGVGTINSKLRGIFGVGIKWQKT